MYGTVRYSTVQYSLGDLISLSRQLYCTEPFSKESGLHLNRSDIKRQAILDTAYRLFRAQGFVKTSIAEVTAQVGGTPACEEPPRMRCENRGSSGEPRARAVCMLVFALN